MWHDILLTNREQIALALAEFAKGIEETRKAVAALPDDTLAHAVFTRGNEGRASLFAPGRNAGSLFHEITVQLKDKPGAILSVMQPLADAHLNIRDIELMKVRENVAGTLLLAFKTEEEASAAVKLLRYLEFEVEER
jgi:prephenate dehydrogenase